MTAPALSLSPKDAAPYVGVSLSTFYTLIRERAIECERPPHGRIRCTLAALDEFKRLSRVPAVIRISRRRSPRPEVVKANRDAVLSGASRRMEIARQDAQGREA